MLLSGGVDNLQVVSAATIPSAKPTGDGDNDIGDKAVPPKNWDFFIPAQTTQKRTIFRGIKKYAPSKFYLQTCSLPYHVSP